MDDESSGRQRPVGKNAKQKQLDQYRISNVGKPMTTNDGRKISNDQDQLKAGIRGPSLHEDHHYFEKMTHFVKEEISQRVVHPRGYGAHGEFECYRSMKHVTKAGFLQEVGKKTPVFNRFSTVQGRSGSKDTRSEEHTSELQSRGHLVCRLLLEKKKKKLSGRQESVQKVQQVLQVVRIGAPGLAPPSGCGTVNAHLSPDTVHEVEHRDAQLHARG